MKKFIRLFVVFVLLLAVGAVVFIKLDTKSAAEFTDNVLRPLLGNKNVIFIEKVFFNASDKFRQLTVKESSIRPPQFNDGSSLNAGQSTNLNLIPIPAVQNFKPLKSEGNWIIKDLSSFPGEAVMAYTFVRPDPNRPYAIVTLAQMDMQKLSLGPSPASKSPAANLAVPVRARFRRRLSPVTA